MSLLDRNIRPLITHSLNFAEWSGGAPKRLDHWIICKVGVHESKQELDRDAMENLRKLGYAPATGDVKVRRMPIRVDSDNIDDFLPQDYKCRAKKPILDKDGNQLLVDGKPKHETFVFCQGNGVEASRLSAKDGTWRSIPCCSRPFYDGKGFKDRPQPALYEILVKKQKYDVNDGLRCPYAQNSDPSIAPVCKPESVLTCRCDAIGSLGTFARYRSHGHKTADRLRSTFEEIKKQLGFLADVPLDLVLSKQRINTPRGPTAMQVAHVELRVSFDEALRLTEARLAQRALIEDRRRLLMASHAVQDSAERIDQEFPVRALPAPQTVRNAEGNGVMTGPGQQTTPIVATAARQPDLIDMPPVVDPSRVDR